MSPSEHTSPCPECRKPTLRTGNPFRPFCSERCKLLDLGRWMSGQYVIEGEPFEDLSEGDDIPSLSPFPSSAPDRDPAKD